VNPDFLFSATSKFRELNEAVLARLGADRGGTDPFGALLFTNYSWGPREVLHRPRWKSETVPSTLLVTYIVRDAGSTPMSAGHPPVRAGINLGWQPEARWPSQVVPFMMARLELTMLVTYTASVAGSMATLQGNPPTATERGVRLQPEVSVALQVVPLMMETVDVRLAYPVSKISLPVLATYTVLARRSTRRRPSLCRCRGSEGRRS
jgi:hypothetical protein